MSSNIGTQRSAMTPVKSSHNPLQSVCFIRAKTPSHLFTHLLANVR